MVTQRRLHFVVTRNDRPLDSAPPDEYRRRGQQRLEIWKWILMERGIGGIVFIFQVRIDILLAMRAL
jgi:hypothetical protein